ncbi:A/G-specific adenine glycosylase [Bacillus timonensis]|nr:A/G-specific adenine glycosylase [Bacillus timonensis]
MKQNVEHLLEQFPISEFQNDLIHWFEREQRDLPWRKDKDPYKVWVSEIMLQQTRVDTVIPYFNRFISKFPTIDSLADAEEDDVLKAWEGLGYYSRVRNLQSAVKEVKEKYNGIVPNSASEISKLKGVGPYTTGAILSIAYGIPEPAVDGNVMRVLSRILSVWEDIAKPKTRHIFEDVVRVIISKENPSYFNQALMELGALICTPTSPSCLLCPVQEHCRAFREGCQNELPIKSKKKAPRAISMAAVVLQNNQGEVLIQKRPSTGLLANLWEFPNAEVHEGIFSAKEQLAEKILLEDGYEVKMKEQFSTIQHIFSHLIWNISVFKGEVSSNIVLKENMRFVDKEEIKMFAFPVSHQKIYKDFLESHT